MSTAVTLPRRLALEAMRRVRRGHLADRAARDLFHTLAPRERAWAVELFYGTLRLRGRLDHILSARVKGGLRSLEPDVLDVLRLGAFQLLEMASVPAYAAVSQSQELVRAAGAGRASRLVAGVLHDLHRAPDVEFPDREQEPVRYLATRGSHPEWLVERWIRRWGFVAAEALVEANNQRPELYVRPIGMGVAIAADRLRAAGVVAEPDPLTGRSLRLTTSAPVADVLRLVPAVVQDPAASLVVDYADAPAGGIVLDLCSAPGGKTAGLTERTAFVAASDVSAPRLALVRENVERLGLAGRVALVVADGTKAPFRPGAADLVLVDAPCTGTGTLRRHPDARWRIRPEHLESLGALQAALCDAAAHLVAPGGVLVYATCSLEEEENELQIGRFLETHPTWRVEESGGVVSRGVIGSDEMLHVLPQRHGVDGSFAARLRRPE